MFTFRNRHDCRISGNRGRYRRRGSGLCLPNFRVVINTEWQNSREIKKFDESLTIFLPGNFLFYPNLIAGRVKLPKNSTFKVWAAKATFQSDAAIRWPVARCSRP